MHRRDVQENATGNNRWVLLGATYVPSPAANMLSRFEMIEYLTIVPKMAERIDVRTAMRVH